MVDLFRWVGLSLMEGVVSRFASVSAMGVVSYPVVEKVLVEFLIRIGVVGRGLGARWGPPLTL